MKNLLYAITAATEALEAPPAEVKFYVEPGAGTSVSILASKNKIKASFTKLLSIFGEPFFDALENPMEDFAGVTASWEFSDDQGGIYILHDTQHVENIESLQNLRDSGVSQEWIIGVSPKAVHALELSNWLQNKITGV